MTEVRVFAYVRYFFRTRVNNWLKVIGFLLVASTFNASIRSIVRERPWDEMTGWIVLPISAIALILLIRYFKIQLDKASLYDSFLSRAVRPRPKHPEEGTG